MNSTASVTINNSNKMRDGIAFRAPRQSTFRLESEIRHATDAGTIRNFTTLLNSDDPAALLPGTRHAPLKCADVLGYAANGSRNFTYQGEEGHESHRL